MKQRIKIATALVHDPMVLLLDEPFNGMDPRQRIQLMELLHAMGEEGRTILFVSHSMDAIAGLCKSALVFRQGQVSEKMSVEDGIREHRDSSGHDLCWHHPQLWGLLPESIDPQPVVPVDELPMSDGGDGFGPGGTAPGEPGACA
mgnify:CR=1 FL=1